MQLTQAVSNPRVENEMAAKTALRYLKGVQYPMSGTVHGYTEASHSERRTGNRTLCLRVCFDVGRRSSKLEYEEAACGRTTIIVVIRVHRTLLRAPRGDLSF